MKTKRFKRVVKYFYPNGDEFKDGFFGYYLMMFIAMLIKWIFFPLFFIFDKEEVLSGNRKVYWEEIK